MVKFPPTLLIFESLIETSRPSASISAFMLHSALIQNNKDLRECLRFGFVPDLSFWDGRLYHWAAVVYNECVYEAWKYLIRLTDPTPDSVFSFFKSLTGTSRASVNVSAFMLRSALIQNDKDLRGCLRFGFVSDLRGGDGRLLCAGCSL